MTDLAGSLVTSSRLLGRLQKRSDDQTWNAGVAVLTADGSRARCCLAFVCFVAETLQRVVKKVGRDADIKGGLGASEGRHVVSHSSILLHPRPRPEHERDTSGDRTKDLHSPGQ